MDDSQHVRLSWWMKQSASCLGKEKLFFCQSWSISTLRHSSPTKHHIWCSTTELGIHLKSKCSLLFTFDSQLIRELDVKLHDASHKGYYPYGYHSSLAWSKEDGLKVLRKGKLKAECDVEMQDPVPGDLTELDFVNVVDIDNDAQVTPSLSDNDIVQTLKRRRECTTEEKKFNSYGKDL